MKTITIQGDQKDCEDAAFLALFIATMDAPERGEFQSDQGAVPLKVGDLPLVHMGSNLHTHVRTFVYDQRPAVTDEMLREEVLDLQYAGDWVAGKVYYTQAESGDRLAGAVRPKSLKDWPGRGRANP